VLKLSIITCAWNSEPYIAECIDSVRAQDYPNLEHIFVDGGSEDGTLERIKSLRGNIKLLENVRGGIGRAMNEGARLAAGDILAHLHSDDIYLGNDALSKVAEAFSKQAGRWLYGRCKSIVNGELQLNNFEQKRYSYKSLLRRNIIQHPAAFYAREAFEMLGGFDSHYRCAMDYDLWLRLGRLGEPIQLEDYLAAFRVHPGSSSTANAMFCHHEALRVRLKHTGIRPVQIGEHLVRHAVRTFRLARTR
jgi:glycosyltransferase involved in cell wall biosynthesis